MFGSGRITGSATTAPPNLKCYHGFSAVSITFVLFFSHRVMQIVIFWILLSEWFLALDVWLSDLSCSGKHLVVVFHCPSSWIASSRSFHIILTLHTALVAKSHRRKFTSKTKFIEGNSVHLCFYIMLCSIVWMWLIQLSFHPVLQYWFKSELDPVQSQISTCSITTRSLAMLGFEPQT